MKLRGLVLLSLTLPVGARAGIEVAKYAGEFLSIGVGGRPLGMGGAFVALANDVTSGYWNPAGLSLIDYPQMVLMHDEQFGGIVNHDYGAVAIPMGPNTSLGLSLIRLGVDGIPNTQNAGLDNNGNLISYSGSLSYDLSNFSRIDPSRVTYFNAADWALYFTYSKREAENFSYGANVKLIRRDLADHSATGIGFDVGLWYSPFENVALGVNMQDVTTTLLAWDTGRNELISPTMKLGSAVFFDLFGGRFSPAVDFDVRFEGRQYASIAHVGPISLDPHVGGEYAFKNLIALRVGYNDVKQFTLGAGLRLPKLTVDYSFARFSDADQLGDTHRISIMFTLEAEQYKRTPEQP